MSVANSLDEYLDARSAVPGLLSTLAFGNAPTDQTIGKLRQALGKCRDYRLQVRRQRQAHAMIATLAR